MPEPPDPNAIAAQSPVSAAVRPDEAEIDEDRPTASPLVQSEPRLAGFVLALLGGITYGTTSPFGLILSYEKLREAGRPRALRVLDGVGLILSIPGCLFVPFLIVGGIYNPSMRLGVICYTVFLVLWMQHRIRVLWRLAVLRPSRSKPLSERAPPKSESSRQAAASVALAVAASRLGANGRDSGHLVTYPAPPREDAEAMPEPPDPNAFAAPSPVVSRPPRRAEVGPDEDRPPPGPSPFVHDKPRLAGLVMAVMGVFTYGTTSPFGLLLSWEKLRETNRPRRLRVLDWIGIVLSVPGCFFLPFLLWGMYHYHLMGPQPVLAYSAFLVGWALYRVFFLWNRRPLQ